nr:3-ketoacyl-CoA synthase 12-like [Ipomoea batatas]GME01649.1 3-ketoacyl-CoA synthase 12-like [Ipomoea batatas]GME05685.1 3-ketoacyl-CoA synthase 12-like [Ipomoea batatas]
MVNSGNGRETYVPQNVLEGRKDGWTLADGIEEMEECFFDTLEKLSVKSGVSPAEIDVLVMNISMLLSASSLCSRIVRCFAMREDVRAFNLSGMGCSANLLSINLVENMFRCRWNMFAIVVTSEFIASFWYSGNDKSMMLTNCLFQSRGFSILLTTKRTTKCSAVACRRKTRMGHVEGRQQWPPRLTCFMEKLGVNIDGEKHVSKEGLRGGAEGSVKLGDRVGLGKRTEEIFVGRIGFGGGVSFTLRAYEPAATGEMAGEELGGKNFRHHSASAEDHRCIMKKLPGDDRNSRINLVVLIKQGGIGNYGNLPLLVGGDAHLHKAREGAADGVQIPVQKPKGSRR